MDTAIFFLLLIGLLSFIQAMAMSVLWQRFQRSLLAQEPRTRRVIVTSLGPDRVANARVLAQHTRLDHSEIEDLIDKPVPGSLPLPLSVRDTNLLITKLRALGGTAESEPRREGNRQ